MSRPLWWCRQSEQGGRRRSPQTDPRSHLLGGNGSTISCICTYHPPDSLLGHLGTVCKPFLPGPEKNKSGGGKVTRSLEDEIRRYIPHRSDAPGSESHSCPSSRLQSVVGWCQRREMLFKRGSHHHHLARKPYAWSAHWSRFFRERLPCYPIRLCTEKHTPTSLRSVNLDFPIDSP